MFQYIGMGEQAGSGFPKMLRAWMEQHWQYPYLVEDTHLETTTLFMPTISLFPKEVQDALEELFGTTYAKLDKDERLALILSFLDGEVANARLSDVGAIHPADSSKILKKLVERKLLISEGVGRGTKYYINKGFDDTAGTTPSETVGKPSEPENLILNYIQANGLIRREDVETLLNVKESRAREILRNMSHDGKIIKINSGKNTYYEENK